MHTNVPWKVTLFSMQSSHNICLRLRTKLTSDVITDAGRQWGMCQDCWIMDSFNTEEPPCKQPFRDPCLFIITASHGTTSCIVCCTGDPDYYAEDIPTMVKISKKFDAKFSIKVIHPDYTLGVVRKQCKRAGVRTPLKMIPGWRSGSLVVWTS